MLPEMKTAELKEVVKFLTDPDSFLNLEQAYPKSLLRTTRNRKTLLAKAIAGAGTPFLKSLVQFVELLVGVGAQSKRIV
jgi:ATP-dependent Zn protease